MLDLIQRHSLSNGMQTVPQNVHFKGILLRVPSILTAYLRQLMLAGSVKALPQDSRPRYQDCKKRYDPSTRPQTVFGMLH